MGATSIFSFSHNIFYPSKIKFQIFGCIYMYFVICNCFQKCTSLEFSPLVKSRDGNDGGGGGIGHPKVSIYISGSKWLYI